MREIWDNWCDDWHWKSMGGKHLAFVVAIMHPSGTPRAFPQVKKQARI